MAASLRMYCSLRMSPEDAQALGVEPGGLVRLTTKRGSREVVIEITETMRRGHVSLPNGLGTAYLVEGGDAVPGVAPNELIAVEDRDPFVGTPWHKHVPARIELVSR